MAKTVVENKEQVLVGEGRDFERIRRITGYLVGTIDRWNNAKRAEEHTVFCLRCGDRLAVERRPDSGLLAGLWQLPNTPGLLDERQAGAFASGQGLGDVRLRSARDGRHIFTHIVWTMRCYTLECSAMPPQYRWAAPDELRTEISLPTAFRQFLEDTY